MGQAGNVWEWTAEIYSTKRVRRGGRQYDKGSDCPAANRWEYNMTESYNELRFQGCTVRYIKIILNANKK